MIWTITLWLVDNITRWWWVTMAFIIVSLSLSTSGVMLLPVLGFFTAVWYGSLYTMHNYEALDASKKRKGKEK